MLSIVVMAMMSGANSVKAISRFAKRLDMPQRKELCMPHAKNKAGAVAKHEYKIPSYVTIYNFLKTLDLDDFARKLTEWMSAQEGTRTEGSPADAHIQDRRPCPARHVRNAHARGDPPPVGASIRAEQGESDESGDVVPRLDH